MPVKFRVYSIVLLLLLSSLLLLVQASRGFAWDYSINWTASLALRNGISLYDRNALRELGVQTVGPVMSRLFDDPFTSYIGLPTTAMLLLPFTAWTFPVSLLIYRIVALLAFICGATIVGFVLPEKLRPTAWTTGGLCLIIWHSIVFSLELGQVDAWIVLVLAISVLAIQYKWWRLAGICIGVAALLKISPGLLLIYCVLKRQWSVVRSATLTVCIGLGLSLLPNQGADLTRFVFYIAPALGGGSIHVQNQALGAWLARLVSHDPHFLSFTIAIGIWRYVGLLIALGLLLILWWIRRRNLLSAIDFSVVIIIALIAGPITWDHYTSWAIIPVMLLMPYLYRRRRMLFILFLILLAFPVLYLTPEAIAAAWWTRIITGTQTISLLGMVLISFLVLQDESKPQTSS